MLATEYSSFWGPIPYLLVPWLLIARASSKMPSEEFMVGVIVWLHHHRACISTNPLHAKFFRGNKKHLFTFYVIPPHLTQCATFPIDRWLDLGKNWVRLGKLSNLMARRSMVIWCVLLYDSISGLYLYTVGLWWIILILDRWSMTSANTIEHTVDMAQVVEILPLVTKRQGPIYSK